MTKIISPGELAVNQLVTVYEWNPVTRDSNPLDIFSTFGTVTQTTHQDHSFCGDILRVTSVMLPYIVVKPLSGGLTNPFELDTRRLSLMEVTNEYAAAKGINP